MHFTLFSFLTNVVNTFQDLFNTLHLAICCTSTKLQPSLKLFHLSHQLCLMFHPDWSQKHLCDFSLLSPLQTLQILPLKASFCASIHGIVSCSSSLTVTPGKVSYSVFIFEPQDLCQTDDFYLLNLFLFSLHKWRYY